ncbi:MAG: bifunctional hydroxymethylpyrimidine kinase/phosphomethylpyrimidine kinase, partial [Verrucomicrobiota bacterium]
APTLLGHQLNSVASHFSIGAAKTGMLANAANVEVTSHFISEHRDIRLVIDPVIFATAESQLLSDEGVEKLKSDLLPSATLATPNIPEAEALLSHSIKSAQELASSPRQLFETYGCSFLVKGGHFDGGDTITDYASINGEAVTFSHSRIDIADTHGTGCTLSAAITANLALGNPLHIAIENGIDYLTRCLAQQFQWRSTGGSIAALNHFPDGVE